MFIPKKLEKYTNYNAYIDNKRMGGHEIEEARLLKVIAKMSKKYKAPYIRFMWMSREGCNDALCVFYYDDTRTKLLPFSEVEQRIMED